MCGLPANDGDATACEPLPARSVWKSRRGDGDLRPESFGGAESRRRTTRAASQEHDHSIGMRRHPCDGQVAWWYHVHKSPRPTSVPPRHVHTPPQSSPQVYPPRHVHTPSQPTSLLHTPPHSPQVYPPRHVHTRRPNATVALPGGVGVGSGDTARLAVGDGDRCLWPSEGDPGRCRVGDPGRFRRGDDGCGPSPSAPMSSPASTLMALTDEPPGPFSSSPGSTEPRGTP